MRIQFTIETSPKYWQRPAINKMRLFGIYNINFGPFTLDVFL